jgi:uncharacterized tellurite resistance protein B-like protein
MTPENLYIALGSAAYAMAKIDGRLQAEELTTLQELLRDDPHGDIALTTFDIKDQYNVPAEEAYQFAFRTLTLHKGRMEQRQQKKFLLVLQQVAEASEGTSRKEQELIYRFRKDLKRLKG